MHIQETKVATCDIVPGRRPQGEALVHLVQEYQSRAGLTTATGNELRTPGALPRASEPGGDGPQDPVARMHADEGELS